MNFAGFLANSSSVERFKYFFMGDSTISGLRPESGFDLAYVRNGDLFVPRFDHQPVVTYRTPPGVFVVQMSFGGLKAADGIPKLLTNYIKAAIENTGPLVQCSKTFFTLGLNDMR